MKILLLEHPRQIAQERCNDIANTPLSSSMITGYTAGMLLSQGHEVQIVEGYLDKLTYSEISAIVRGFAPDILGVHTVYSWENNEKLFSFLKTMKKEGIRHITVYGFYPTFAYAEIFRQCPEIDSIIIGEPELTFAELAAKETDRTSNNSQGIRNIPGLAWQDNQSKIYLQRRELLQNLDDLPYPIRTKAMLRIPEINIEGSRGCYGGCTFCYINPYYGKASCWRGRSPESIIAEIDQLINQYGQRNFYFVDPNFFGPGLKGRGRALDLASLLKERDIQFGIEGRVNDITEELISTLVEAGLNQILIGLESGRNESLQRLNKMTTVEQNEKAIRILRQYGIEPNVGFIMFEPNSSLEDIRINFEFLQRNDLLTQLAITANVLYHPQIILQGTKAYQNLQKEGRLQLLTTTYEGTASFANPQVAALALIMSRITNHLFVKMNGIWSGREPEPQNADIVYSQLNQTVIQYFHDSLTALESGKQFVDKEIAALVDQAKEEINRILP